MKICAVQLRPHPGDLRANLRAHLRALRLADALGAAVVVFPELSLTGYEPTLARGLALRADDPALDPLQRWADARGVTICAGLPTPAPDGVRISLALFQPHAPRAVYSKQLLHDDELPFFVPGHAPARLTARGVPLGLGICFETLQRAHFAQAVAQGAAVYLASVAKPQRGVARALAHFPQVAAELATPVVMANGVGPCDDFISAGQSAAWSATGERLCALGALDEGVVVYDTARGTAAAHALRVEPATPDDVDALWGVYRRAREALNAQGSDAWTDAYPTRAIVEDDAQQGVLYALRLGREVAVGAVHLSEAQEAAYAAVPWALDDPAPLVVHRLVVDPAFQGAGFASELVAFAEAFARTRRYASIRLDVYTRNAAAIALYTRSGYAIRGEVRFPGRAHPFYCMERVLA